MRPTLFTIGFLAVILVSCSEHATKGTYDYDKLNYDTSRIAIFKWDTTGFDFPKNSEPLPLIQEDVKTIDSLLRISVDSFNKNQTAHLKELNDAFDNKVKPEDFLINLKEYKRQYLPYVDNNGQKIVWVNCFCTRWRSYERWRKYLIIIEDGGPCYFNVKVNLTTKDYHDFYANGYG